MNDLDIKEIRKKIDVSQEKLAEMLGVVRKTIQNWEAGGVIPQSKRVILLNLLNQTKEKEKEKIQDPQPDDRVSEASAVYNRDVEIQLLKQRIADLERTIKDKERIIQLLESQLTL